MWQWIKSLFQEDRLFGSVRSSQWPKIRKEHLKKYPVCDICGTKKDLSVHHEIPVNFDKSLELSPENLLTLCDSGANDCHRIFGHLFDFHSYSPHVRIDIKEWKKRISEKPKK